MTQSCSLNQFRKTVRVCRDLQSFREAAGN